MSDIAAFLKARADEDEAAAKAARDAGRLPWQDDEWSDQPEEWIDHYGRHDPARVLREVAAKRKILARHEPQPFWGNNPPPAAQQTDANVVAWFCDCQCPDGVIEGEYPCETARDLASAWSDHADFDPSWAVPE